MKAWLVTWEWIGDHAQVKDRLVAIFNSKYSTRRVLEFVKRHYLLFSCTANEFIYYANRPSRIVYKASTEVINGIPHGSIITCGHNPWIYARIVSNLRVEAQSEIDSEVL